MHLVIYTCLCGKEKGRACVIVESISRSMAFRWPYTCPLFCSGEVGTWWVAINYKRSWQNVLQFGCHGYLRRDNVQRTTHNMKRSTKKKEETKKMKKLCNISKINSKILYFIRESKLCINYQSDYFNVLFAVYTMYMYERVWSGQKYVSRYTWYYFKNKLNLCCKYIE